MASIRKRKDQWQAEVRTKGFYKSKCFATKHEAQAWALDMELSRGRNYHRSTGKTVRDAMQKFAEEISLTRKGGRWEIIRINKLSNAAFANIMLDDLMTQDIQDWIDAELKRLKPASVNRELHVLCAVLKAARIRWKWISHDVTKDLIRPKKQPPRDKLYSDAQIQLILEGLEYVEGKPAVTTRQQIAVAFLLALETAMRQGELFSTDWKNVDLKEQYVHLPDTKNGTSRNVLLSKKAVKLLKSLPKPHSGKLFSVGQETAGTMFRRTLQLAGIEGFTFHDSRHYAITHLAQKLKMLDLARMVGHKDPRSLMILL